MENREALCRVESLRFEENANERVENHGREGNLATV